jgi:hypothetical protein
MWLWQSFTGKTGRQNCPLRSTQPRFARTTKISSTCIRRRPQNMLERSECLADWNKHHIQEIQGICPHVSGRPSDQSTQLGHLSHLDSTYGSRNQKTKPSSSLGSMGKFCFHIGVLVLSSVTFYLASRHFCFLEFYSWYLLCLLIGR